MSSSANNASFSNLDVLYEHPPGRTVPPSRAFHQMISTCSLPKKQLPERSTGCYTFTFTWFLDSLATANRETQNFPKSTTSAEKSREAHQVDNMADRSKRDALRGVEVDTIDAIFDVLAPEQWAELLTTPLKRASATRATETW